MSTWMINYGEIGEYIFKGKVCKWWPKKKDFDQVEKWWKLFINKVEYLNNTQEIVAIQCVLTNIESQ